jgi:hypothetical protein
VGIEKALTKKAAADELVDGLRKQIANELKALDYTKGGAASVLGCIEQLKGVHVLLERDLDDGNVSDEEYKVAKRYLVRASNLIQGMHNSMKASIPEVKYRVEGVQKSIGFIESYAKSQEANAERAKREEEEEDEYRQDLEERRQGNGNAPHGDEEEPLAQESQETSTCPHCKLPIEKPSGSSLCVPCVSYKNRWKKLPPDHVVEARKKRSEEAVGRNS